MHLPVKRLTPTAKLPTRAHPHDAGLDLYADENIEIPEFNRAKVRTGIAVDVPVGAVGLIWPRSGLATHGKSKDAGVVDAGYIGEVSVVMTNNTPHRYAVKVGDKIAQLLIQPVLLVDVQEVDELNPTERGAGGFGSTGA